MPLSLPLTRPDPFPSCPMLCGSQHWLLMLDCWGQDRSHGLVQRLCRYLRTGPALLRRNLSVLHPIHYRLFLYHRRKQLQQQQQQASQEGGGAEAASGQEGSHNRKRRRLDPSHPTDPAHTDEEQEEEQDPPGLMSVPEPPGSLGRESRGRSAALPPLHPFLCVLDDWYGAVLVHEADMARGRERVMVNERFKEAFMGGGAREALERMHHQQLPVWLLLAR